MDVYKFFTIIINGIPIANMPVYPSNTIDQLKFYLNNLYPNSTLTIYLNQTDTINPDQHDNISISDYWNRINDGRFLLNNEYIDKLKKDFGFVITGKFEKAKNIYDYLVTGKKVKFKDNHGHLQTAVDIGSLEFLKFAYSLYEKNNKKNDLLLGEALSVALLENKSKDIVAFLVEQGIDPTGSLSMVQNVDTVKYLISKGVSDFEESLENAAKKGNYEVFIFLEPYGTDDMWTLLLLAAVQGGNMDIVKSILSKNIDKSFIKFGIKEAEKINRKDLIDLLKKY